MREGPRWRRVATCKCGAEPVYLARYSGHHLCPKHFLESVEKRVRKEVRKQGPFGLDKTIAVALSGGKDSVVTLRLLHEAFRDNPRLRLVAISVDEGIAGYRPAALEAGAAHCRELGIEHHIVSYQQTAGLTMDVVAARPDRAHLPCAYCGVLRRVNLNQAARDVGADFVATGHNLDDTAQSILMNHLKGDVARLARMAPHPPDRVNEGLVPRILPLRAIPEKEVALYAILKGWDFHDGECPYSVEATRGRYRDMLLELEAQEPGTRHSLLAGYDRLAPLVRGLEDAKLRPCDRCGEPTSGKGECRACTLVGSVGGKLNSTSRSD